MSKKATGIVAYITFIGWIIAFLAGDKEGAKVHLNNGLILVFATLINFVIGFIPLLGWVLNCILGIAIFVYAIIGIVYAATDQDKELPLIGMIKILK